MNTSKRLNRRVRINLETLKIRLKRFLPILILIPVILFLNSLFIIKKINCSFNNEVCPQEIQIVQNNLIGSNSLLINQKDLLTFFKAAYPIDKMSIGYQAFNTLNINLKGNDPYLQVDVYLVSSLPKLSMDQAPSTTDSAGWWVKPSGELESFVLTQKALGFNLWENGSMSQIATTGANISFIFIEKPTPEILSSVYKMVRLVLKYLDVSDIYTLGRRSFLSRPNEPDIIIGVPFDEGSLVSALQSLSYLATIKKDAKVIDLSFKNPIIR
ncbi:TPA: hypothetical protein DCS00_02980 [Candidatus Collierbacteria bacterium]|nr:hypothetical protein [Candidatus Collierbacteria bacterium]